MKIKFNKSIEATITRKLEVGQELRIISSPYHADILEGTIIILDIDTAYAMNDESYDFNSWMTNGELPQFWVKYKYDGSFEEDILPLAEFLNHTVAL